MALHLSLKLQAPPLLTSEGIHTLRGAEPSLAQRKEEIFEAQVQGVKLRAYSHKDTMRVREVFHNIPPQDTLVCVLHDLIHKKGIDLSQNRSTSSHDTLIWVVAKFAIVEARDFGSFHQTIEKWTSERGEATWLGFRDNCSEKCVCLRYAMHLSQTARNILFAWRKPNARNGQWEREVFEELLGQTMLYHPRDVCSMAHGWDPIAGVPYSVHHPLARY